MGSFAGMAALTWISGASAGIGQALVATVPWEGRVIGISRRPPGGVEHLEADLADPAGWETVGASFRSEVDDDAYRDNVVLNSAAPQILGHHFLAAVARLDGVARHLVHLTSGAASSVYPGWSSYGAAKAAIDQWTRNAGAEQDRRGGTQVLAVAPGTVDTAMQARMRDTSEHDFPARAKFVELHRQGRLSDAHDVARRIWSLLDRHLDNGAVVDLRQLHA